MQTIREAFLSRDALAVIVGLLADPLSRHPRMKDQDALLVQVRGWLWSGSEVGVRGGRVIARKVMVDAHPKANS